MSKCFSQRKDEEAILTQLKKVFHPEQLIVAHAGQGLVDLPMTVTDPSMTNEGVSK